jgi:uncharacterized membrane protein HdeD (DUF308 family)
MVAVNSARGNRWWLIIAGILLIILGIKAIVLPLFFAFALTLILGIVFFIGGIVQLIQALRWRRSDRFWLKLAVSVFYILGGLFLLFNPTTGTVALASAVGMLLTAVGIFEVLQPFLGRRREKHDWLSLFVGVVILVLGLFIWVESPLASVVMTSSVAGISLILSGISVLVSAFMVGRLRR